MNKRLCIACCLSFVMASWAFAQQEKTWTVPGEVRTTWVGNSFKGDSPHAQVGRWVQNNIDEIAVTADGTVITASGFDENGRCTGLYKDGDVNYEKVRQYNGKGGHKVWGWGTSSAAVAAEGEYFFIANSNGDLMRFRWDPGDLNSHEYIDQARYCPGDTKENRSRQIAADELNAIGLSARGNRLSLVQDDGTMQIWDAGEELKRTGDFTVYGAVDVALTDHGTMWIISGSKVLHVSQAGEIQATIDTGGKPTAVHVSPDGKLLVCDNSYRCQVLVYDVTAAPKLILTHGREGGIRTGTPGELEPDKFYGLRGANYDTGGNLYVAFDMGFGAAGTTIRSFDPDGNVRWDLKCMGFVDCFDIDPASDGGVLYTSQEILTFDSDVLEPNHWGQTAMTVDPLKYPKDNRRSGGVQIVRAQGRRILAWYHQTSGGPRLHAFEPGDSHIARPVLDLTGEGGWSWDVDAEGSIWVADAGRPKRTIKRWRLLGWNEDDTPRYNLDEPEIWPWPNEWKRVCRIVYVPEADTLYVSGHTSEFSDVNQQIGMVGPVFARYDNWTSGGRNKRYETVDLPRDLREWPKTPKSISVAGDYVFMVACWHSGDSDKGDHKLDGKPLMVHVYRADNGEYVGNMWGPWKPLPIVDTKHGINAFKRSNGQYILVVEEVYRGKNIVYLWTPSKK